jgi:N-acetylglucosamine-6-phosphate deacetylase
VSLLIAGKLTLSGAARNGWIEIDGGMIAAIGADRPPREPDLRPSGLIAPGLFDLQLNGAAGVEITEGAAALRAIERTLLQHGVTRCLATVITAEESSAARAVEELEPRVADPASPIAGIHLEGPFLNPEHAGVHRPELLRRPADGVPSYYNSRAVRLVTLAPELPRALPLIASLRERGVAVSLGHSGASDREASAAIDAGAALVTHLFNAMAAIHHRDPGLVGVALEDERVTIGVIPDGVHVEALVLRLVRRLGGERVALVSDAGPLAGARQGALVFASTETQIGGDGAPRDPDGRLAGSAILLDEGIRRWSQLTGASIAAAVAAASERPALALGLDAGLQPGRSADLVLLDGKGTVQRTMKAGRWIE